MGDLLSLILWGAGGVFLLTSVLGLWRLPDVYCRLHAVGIADVLGVPLVLAGFAVQSGFSLLSLKLALLALAMLVMSPIATHLMARMAYRDGKRSGEGPHG
jgi:multicomponent Na+:H+ antiporter subunit G